MERIYTDGSGDGRFCWFNDTKNISRSYRLSGITNNEAEYLAIYRALTESKAKEVEILSDSKLVVNQLNRKWHIKEARLRKLFDKIQGVIERKGIKVRFKWISRKNNLAGKYLG